jgi:DNA mismatch repair protein MutL
MENALDSRPSRIEVRFIKMGLEGFDIIDDGVGIPENEFASLCKTLPNRERNDLYKSRSIGYMGEALYSLCKSSEVTILTKSADSDTGFELMYDSDGELAT